MTTSFRERVILSAYLLFATLLMAIMLIVLVRPLQAQQTQQTQQVPLTQPLQAQMKPSQQVASGQSLQGFDALLEKVTVSGSVDSREITIGDEITYTVNVTHPAGVTIEMPPFASNLGSFEIKDYRRPDPVKLENGLVERSVIYVISAYATGEFTIPPLSVAIRVSDGDIRNLSTESIAITVKSVADSPEDLAEIREINSPMQVPEEPMAVWIWVVAVLVFALIIWLVYRRMKASVVEDDIEIMRIPPHEWFTGELDAIEHRGVPGPGGARIFHYHLSEVLRRYFVLLIPGTGMDQLTGEFLESIRSSGLFDDDFFRELVERMEEHDFVKFARQEPEDAQCLSELEWARAVVDRTFELSEGVFRKLHEKRENPDEKGQIEADRMAAAADDNDETDVSGEGRTE
ncbi:MAG: hypothetical protein CVV64_15415 [Candidatus Wallbacteria bacterium HGW-Wallbacteria-1]|jgi:hypothetical protein|uniref:DUF11 domain-containing protein n=1 Tax=Candidatus Wallbacteria bacterium HGW-Wallbacteria-1 TaxID=2013854 RepID=A0A2N1PLI2_9BACT|nr:MAG: hypothetical protein CVV64_15415 [Candidatus Wallbacteria bacterium HGW-Wallbacteria-1]